MKNARLRLISKHGKLVDKSGKLLKRLLEANRINKTHARKASFAKTSIESKTLKKIYDRSARLVEKYQKQFHANAKKMDDVLGKLSRLT